MEAIFASHTEDVMEATVTEYFGRFNCYYESEWDV